MSLSGLETFRRENGNSLVINVQTDSYTLTPEDNGALVLMNKATAVNLTVPATLPVGFDCGVLQVGAGQITFVASSTTINNRQGHTKSAGQHAMVRLFHYSLTATSADIFNLSGDTAA